MLKDARGVGRYLDARTNLAGWSVNSSVFGVFKIHLSQHGSLLEDGNFMPSTSDADGSCEATKTSSNHGNMDLGLSHGSWLAYSTSWRFSRINANGRSESSLRNMVTGVSYALICRDLVWMMQAHT